MTVTPAVWNAFTIRTGASFQYLLTWLADNTPVDLTGYSAEMKVRYSLYDCDAILDLTTENGGLTLGGTDGTIQILIDASATESLNAGKAVYDLKLISSGGLADFLIVGTINIIKTVTG